MSSLIQLVGVALCGLLMCVFLKSLKSELAAIAAVITCAILLLHTLNPVMYAIDYVRRLSERYAIADGYIETVFRVIGIGYICTLAAQLCKDAGQAAVGVQVELFGKVLILVQALPIAAKLLDTLIGIL